MCPECKTDFGPSTRRKLHIPDQRELSEAEKQRALHEFFESKARDLRAARRRGGDGLMVDDVPLHADPAAPRRRRRREGRAEAPAAIPMDEKDASSCWERQVPLPAQAEGKVRTVGECNELLQLARERFDQLRRGDIHVRSQENGEIVNIPGLSPKRVDDYGKRNLFCAMKAFSDVSLATFVFDDKFWEDAHSSLARLKRQGYAGPLPSRPSSLLMYMKKFRLLFDSSCELRERAV
jgi:hypothetical protein